MIGEYYSRHLHWFNGQHRASGGSGDRLKESPIFFSLPYARSCSLRGWQARCISFL